MKQNQEAKKTNGIRTLLRAVALGCALGLAPAVPLLQPAPLCAQPVPFASVGQPLAQLAEAPQSLFLLDSHLYVASSGVLLQGRRLGTDIVGFVPDTLLASIDDGIDYVVRHPGSGELYYTCTDRRGRRSLHAATVTPGRKTRTRRIRLGDHDVLQPTFSADGRIMVFASAERRRSYGGTDLWYATLDADGRWSEPVNMGSRVNSEGDELSPRIQGPYLFFSSNGRPPATTHHRVYATRLLADRVVGDTVSMLPIGRSPVLALPMGINSASADCQQFVYDSALRTAYWHNSASGLRRYSGTLAALTLWGHLYDPAGRPLAGATISSDDPVARTLSAPDGLFRLTLPADVADVNIHVSLPGYFSFDTVVRNPQRDPSLALGTDVQCDVVLPSLPIGRPFTVADLFGPDAVTTLSAAGIERLQPLVRFLADNPQLRAELTLFCPLTDDPTFNALLAARRLQRIADHLAAAGIDSKRLQLNPSGTATGTSADRLDTLAILLK